MKWSVIALLTAGVAAWYVIFGGFHRELITLGPLGPWWLLVFLLVVMAAAWIPPVAAPIYRLLQRLSRPSPGGRVIGAVVVSVLSAVYLYFTAASQHRQFFPYIHDEFSYLIQAHQLAKHRLWMPGHPLGQFFDSFQLFTQPVYASAYFPGTAIVHLPGIWLHWQPYVTSLIASGAVVGLLYWITTELLDGLAGWLAVLLLLSDSLFRQLSILTLAHIPVLLYALLATVCWLRWRRNYQNEWAIGIGFFLGLAAVTRPVDALCFAIPIGIAVLATCFRRGSIAAITGIAAGLIPFVSLQLLLNHGITGSWVQTPFGLYADTEYPGTNYGFHPYDPAARPQSELPQMQKLYDRYQPLLRQHRPDKVLGDLLHHRLGFVLSQLSPSPFPVLILLLPIAVVGLATEQRGTRAPIVVLLATLALFPLLYIPYFLFLPTYVLPTAPAIIIGILLGAKVLANTWPSAKRFATVALTIFITGISVASLPNWWHQAPEDVFQASLLASINQQLAALPHYPAVVLFKFDPARNIDEEPVYNADVAWPDEAKVIRAHDLGPLNEEIFGYYAQRQPRRFFYRYDERTRTLQSMGRAGER